MTSKIVPKSLHTVSVLVVMARTIYRASAFSTSIGTVYSVSIPGAVHQALELLGYNVDADFYGLAEQAIKKLNKEF